MKCTLKKILKDNNIYYTGSAVIENDDGPNSV